MGRKRVRRLVSYHARAYTLTHTHTHTNIHARARGPRQLTSLFAGSSALVSFWHQIAVVPARRGELGTSQMGLRTGA